MQRHLTFAVPLGAAHFCATETARALHANSECTGALGILHGTLHRPAERNAICKLICHALCHESCVELGGLDLNDVELDPRIAGDLGDHLAKFVSLSTFTTNHDARTGGVNIDAELVTGALDLDAADGCGLETLHN